MMCMLEAPRLADVGQNGLRAQAGDVGQDCRWEFWQGRSWRKEQRVLLALRMANLPCKAASTAEPRSNLASTKARQQQELFYEPKLHCDAPSELLPCPLLLENQRAEGTGDV